MMPDAAAGAPPARTACGCAPVGLAPDGTRRPAPGRRPAPILTAVNLTPTEVDRLLLHLAASLARARRDRGLRLNVPEATAIIADTVAEAARDGRTHPEAVEVGRSVLGPDDVLPGVADIVTQVHVEAVFDDGSRLVTIVDPIGGGHLGQDAPGALIPGIHRDDEGVHVGDATRTNDIVTVAVVNESVVPISVSSHFHFFEVNPRLRFDRAAAYGRRLDVPAGSTVAFAPGEPVEVALVPIGGARVVVGFAGLVDGPLDAPGARDRALAKARACGFADSGAPEGAPAPADGPAAPADAVPALVRNLVTRTDRAREGSQP
jgi:urease subunit gamma/beta